MNTEPVKTTIGADASQFTSEVNKAVSALERLSARMAATAGAVAGQMNRMEAASTSATRKIRNGLVEIIPQEVAERSLRGSTYGHSLRPRFSALQARQQANDLVRHLRMIGHGSVSAPMSLRAGGEIVPLRPIPRAFIVPGQTPFSASGHATGGGGGGRRGGGPPGPPLPPGPPPPPNPPNNSGGGGGGWRMPWWMVRTLRTGRDFGRWMNDTAAPWTTNALQQATGFMHPANLLHMAGKGLGAAGGWLGGVGRRALNFTGGPAQWFNSATTGVANAGSWLWGKRGAIGRGLGMAAGTLNPMNLLALGAKGLAQLPGAAVDFYKTMAPYGTSMFSGLGAGLLSHSPIKGMFGGAVSGAFMGGPVGAVLGGTAGLIGGTAGMGIHLLTEGLGLAVNLTKSLVEHTVKLGMEYQKNVAFFRAFTGSDDEARGIMKGLQTTATTSPFKFNQLTGPAGLLMGYGTDPKNVNAVVGRLSMIAAGDPTRLERLALAYAQTQSHGRLMGQELRQFGEAGIGAADFAKTLGVSSAQFKAMGPVDASVVRDTINRLTSPGGRYSEVNQQLLTSVEGRVNQLVETVEIKLGELGSKMFERFAIGDVIGGVTAAFGPIVDQWMPRIEEGLDAMFKSAGDLSGLFIDTAANLGTAAAELWSGPFGKMFLPQTWDQFRVQLMAAGGVVAIFGGMMADAAVIAQSSAMVLLAVASQNPATIGLSMTNLNTTLASGNKYTYKAQQDVSKSMADMTMNMIADKTGNELFRRGNLFSRLNAAGKTNAQAPELDLIFGEGNSAQSGMNSYMKYTKGMREATSTLGEGGMEDLKRMRSLFARAGKLSPFETFVDNLEDIDELIRPTKKAAELFPYATDNVLSMGYMDKLKFLNDNSNLITGEQASMARFAAFQQLRSAFPSAADTFRLPSGAMADTAEAVKTMVESSTAPRESFEDEVKRILEEANKQREKQLEEQEKLNQFLKDNPIVVVKKKV